MPTINELSLGNKHMSVQTTPADQSNLTITKILGGKSLKFSGNLAKFCGSRTSCDSLHYLVNSAAKNHRIQQTLHYYIRAVE